MASRSSSTSSSWADPPFPKHGDQDKKEVWAAVGQVLSAWAGFEHEFGRLFAAFVTPDRWLPQIERSYGAIRTFEARQAMVRAAAEAYFAHFDLDFDQGKKELRDILLEVKDAGRVRNNIAHGFVKPYKFGYCLFPSYFDTSRRDKDNVAEFIYDATIISTFGNQFTELRTPIFNLTRSIVDRRKTSRRRFPLRPPW
jgi:ribosomal protein S17E